MVEVESLGPEVWGLGFTAGCLPGPKLDGCLLGMLQDFGGAMLFRDCIASLFGPVAVSHVQALHNLLHAGFEDCLLPTPVSRLNS